MNPHEEEPVECNLPQTPGRVGIVKRLKDVTQAKKALMSCESLISRLREGKVKSVVFQAKENSLLRKLDITHLLVGDS
jgi:hypothetical protein